MTMKTRTLLLGITALATLTATRALAQAVVNSGSDGSLGDLVVSDLKTVALPPDGRLNYKSVRVEQGGTLRFTPQLTNLNTR